MSQKTKILLNLLVWQLIALLVFLRELAVNQIKYGVIYCSRTLKNLYSKLYGCNTSKQMDSVKNQLLVSYFKPLSVPEFNYGVAKVKMYMDETAGIYSFFIFIKSERNRKKLFSSITFVDNRVLYIKESG